MLCQAGGDDEQHADQAGPHAEFECTRKGRPKEEKKDRKHQAADADGGDDPNQPPGKQRAKRCQHKADQKQNDQECRVVQKSSMSGMHEINRALPTNDALMIKFSLDSNCY